MGTLITAHDATPAQMAFQAFAASPSTIERQLDVERVQDLVEQGLLTIKAFTIPFRDNFTGLERYRAKHSGRESQWHVELKLSAGLWLRSMGAGDVVFETGGVGFTADVSSEKFNIIVECGHTDPLRVAAVFKRPGLQFVQVPFECGEHIPAYLLEASAKGQDSWNTAEIASWRTPLITCPPLSPELASSAGGAS